MTREKLDLSAIYPWGCKAWVKRLDVGKLDPRAEECRFVGIDAESKGYRVYWPTKNRVSIVYFNENDVRNVAAKYNMSLNFATKLFIY